MALFCGYGMLSRLKYTCGRTRVAKLAEIKSSTTQESTKLERKECAFYEGTKLPTKKAVQNSFSFRLL